MQVKFFLILSLLLNISWVASAERLLIDKFENRDSARTYVLLNSGNHFYVHEDDTKFKVVDTMYQLADAFQLDSFLHRIQFCEAFAYSQLGHADSSIQILDKAIPLANKFRDTSYEMDSYVKLAECYGDLNQDSLAFLNANRARKLARDLKDRKRLASVNIVLAKSYAKADDYSASLYREAYEGVKDIKHGNVVVILINLGRIYLYMDEPKIDSALHYIQKGVDLNVELKQPNQLALANLALTNAFSEQPIKADSILNELRLSEPEISSLPKIAWIAGAKSSFDLGRISDAEKFIKTYLDDFDPDESFNDGSLKNANFIKQVAQSLKNLELYAASDVMMQTIKDSLHFHETYNSINRIKSNFTLLKKDEEILRQEHFIKFRNYLLAGILGITLVLGLLFFKELK
ncbi:MAG: hypothetical protein AAGK97_13500 [Bacteroidota bacterium]